MALKLAQQTQFGIDVEYHRIIAINVLYETGLVDVTIGSYLTQAARGAGKEPISRTRLPVLLPTPALAGDPRVAIYNYLAQTAPAPVAGIDPATGEPVITVAAPVLTGFNGAASM
jgi:hypothetical protein